MKNLQFVLGIILATLLTACQGPRHPFGHLPASEAFVITPGTSVGDIKLLENVDSLRQSLGQPLFTDAAMGKEWATWYIDQDTTRGKLSIYSEKKMGVGNEIGKIKQIRISDTAYRTREGVGTGDSIINIARLFLIRPIATFYRQKQKYTVYGTRIGMGFVVNPKGICGAVIIYNPKDSLTQTYLPYTINQF